MGIHNKLAVITLGLTLSLGVAAGPEKGRPNILIAISDDHSWIDTSMEGSSFVETPNLDQVARQGFRFANAYAGSPGCSPSRASLLTGQHHWMLGAAGTHGSSFPAHYVTFVDLLENAGYKVGFTGKGWAPGDWYMGGRTQNPAGKEYNEIQLDYEPAKGISKKNYAENFRQFMSERDADEPFYFWYGAHEPHLKYAEQGHDEEQLAKVDVPGFLPDTNASREMLLDYADEISHFDQHLGKIIEILRESGELDNTLVIVTADNGMPMPRAKANGFEYGIHVPLAISWGDQVEPGTVVEAPVGFVDFAPTILEAVGIPAPDQLVGQSLLGLLTGTSSGLDPDRAVYSGRERHSSSRYLNRAYPQRMMRRGDYLVVWSMKPDRYPAGSPKRILEGELGPPHAAYHDIDDSMSKRELIAGRDDPYIGPFFHLAVDKRPEWQLFNVVDDPACMNDLAIDPAFAEMIVSYQTQLKETLKTTGDPRVHGFGDLWEDYPRTKGQLRYFPKPD